MKRGTYLAATIAIMLVVSGILVWLVDAAVQIDDDIGTLLLLLLAVNAAIGASSYMVYRKHTR